MTIIVSINYYKRDGNWRETEQRVIDGSLTETEVREFLATVSKHPKLYATYKFSSGSRLKEYLVIPKDY